MAIQRLVTRFLLAGCLLAAITIGVGLWSALTFASLGQVVDRALRNNRETIDLASSVEGSLEREDDALLLAIGGEPDRASEDLEAERRRGDDFLLRLRLRSHAEHGQDDLLPRIEALDSAVSEYREAGSALVAGANDPDAFRRYHEQVNPRLRLAVQACDRIRVRNFEAIRNAGEIARDEARIATGIVLVASFTALGLAVGVAAWLAGSVVPPIRTLADSVDAIRRGDFDHRVTVDSADEFGRLASGFNRMAETLAEYRRSSLGELLASKTTLESTLAALPDAVFVIDPDGRLAALNPPARAILDAEQVIEARRFHDLPIDPIHHEAIASALAGRPVLPSRAGFDQVVRVRLGGRPRALMLSALPIPSFAASKTGAVVVLNDVTEFALLDELRSELIAVASHELKSPLTTLRMNLMLLAEAADALPPSRREMLDASLDACEEFASTIDELLDMTRIEAGQLRLDLGQVDLLDLIEAAIRSLQARLDDAEVRLEVVREATSTLVLGDPSRLRTVLANLLSNALKYASRGGSITVRVSDGESGEILISVVDDGPGVPEHFRDRVFEKFFRVENHADRPGSKIPGTGIGLFLCREIARAHGGSIRVGPGPEGIGSTFTLALRSSRQEPGPTGLPA